MKIQNQNATDQNDMANYKRMLDSRMWTSITDRFADYSKNQIEDGQKEDNVDLSLIHLMGAYPDLVKNENIKRFLANRNLKKTKKKY